MTKKFNLTELREFLNKPRLAILLYHGKRPAPIGVPVWFDWDGKTVHMFAGRTSAKVKQLQNNPEISVLITNDVGEPEGWVAFDGRAELSDFTSDSWQKLLDKVAPRYWDMSQDSLKTEIDNWRTIPEAFIAISLTPSSIRSGS